MPPKKQQTQHQAQPHQSQPIFQNPWANLDRDASHSYHLPVSSHLFEDVSSPISCIIVKIQVRFWSLRLLLVLETTIDGLELCLLLSTLKIRRHSWMALFLAPIQTIFFLFRGSAVIAWLNPGCSTPFPKSSPIAFFVFVMQSKFCVICDLVFWRVMDHGSSISRRVWLLLTKVLLTSTPIIIG